MRIALRVTGIVLLMSSAAAFADDAQISFQCEASAQQDSSNGFGPFSIEINGKSVKQSGVGVLDGNFSLIRKSDAYYVFKNSKNQGGNINRANGAVELYAVNAASHKMTVSIIGVCVERKHDH
jgi:hypothetical protein